MSDDRGGRPKMIVRDVGRFLSNFPIDRNHHFSSSSSPVRRRHRLLLQPNTVAEFAFTCSTDGSVDAVWFFVGWW